MNPMPINRRVLIWLYMYPPMENVSRSKTMASICFTSAVCLTLAGCVMSSIAFIFRFIMIDIKDTLYATFPTIACSGLVYVHIVAVHSRQNIFDLFKKLSKIYQTSEWMIFSKDFQALTLWWYVELIGFSLHDISKSCWKIYFIKSTRKFNFQPTYQHEFYAVCTKKCTLFLMTWIFHSAYSTIDDESYGFLAMASNKSDMFWKFYIKYILSGFAINSVAMAITSVWFCWLWNGQFDVKYLYHPHKLVYVNHFTSYISLNGSINNRYTSVCIQFTMEWKNSTRL